MKIKIYYIPIIKFLLIGQLILFNCLFESTLQAETINEVIISGNTKTRKSALLKWGGIEIGKEISQEDLNTIIEKLKRVYQFNLKNISFKNNILNIDIEEKWSLFPIPMITQSGHYYSRGLLLYENNFLGNLGTLAPGIFWTNSGLNALLYFQQDNLLAQNIGMKVILLHKSDLTEVERQGAVVDSFESRFDTIILTPNLNIGRHDHKLGPIFIKKEIYKLDKDPIFKSQSLGLYYRNHYNNYVKLPILFDGLETTYDLFVLYNNNKVNYLNGGDIQYCLPLSDHFLKFQTHFHYTNSKDYLAPKTLGGNEGHRGYDRESLPVQKNIGLMISPQMKLKSSLYSSFFYEYNYSQLIRPVLNGTKLSESTVGLNLSYYFKSISIPALVLEYARNLDDHSHHVHINVGLKL